MSISSVSMPTTSLASLTRDSESLCVVELAADNYRVLPLHSLCPELPIDVVYTWVNGSDPHLLEALRELKRQQTHKSDHIFPSNITLSLPLP